MVNINTIPKSPAIPEIVFQEIQGLIIDGDLLPGDMLPSEMELAERFGVGRSSIREAMRALQLIGAIEVIQGKGTFVRDFGILPLVVDWARISQMGIISEVMEARQFIEVVLVQLAAERAVDENIEAMRASLKHAQETTTNVELNVETNAQAGVDFHIALADAAHNHVLALMYRTIRELYLETARRTRITPEIALDRCRDHEDILQAVIDRDPEAAAQIMKDHLEKASQILSASEQEETPNEEKDT